MKPLNRHLLVLCETQKEKEEEQPTFFIPDDVKVTEPPYKVVEVLDLATNCSLEVKVGEKVVVESSQIQAIEVEGNTHHLVLENYVYGVV